MGRYTNILSHLLDEAGPRNAWGFWADFAIILYAMQDDVLQAADQSEQWAELVCTCVRQIHDFPIDHWEPQKNISKGCVVIVRKILQDLPEDRQVFRQNTAALLDELLQQMIDRKYIVDLITPLSLADLMAAMVVPQEPCRILDPVCGSGRLLLAARRVNPAANLLGFEISESISAAARLRLGMEENGNSDVEQTDFFLKTPYLEQRFDVILANPPYDRDLRNTVRYIDAFFELLESQGRCAVLVPEGLLSNTINQKALELRDFLLRSQSVEAVISLPLKMYWPYTTSHSSLLLFQKGQGRQEVFFGRIPDRAEPDRGLSDQSYWPDMEQVLRAWKCWSAGNPVPEDAQALCWTVSKENIERTEDHVLSAEQYRLSPYIHLERQIGELDHVRHCQVKLEDLLIRYVMEQETANEM